MTNRETREVLQEQIDKYGQEYDEKGIDALNTAIKLLEQTRWIPVSEKNPNETGEYFTTIKWLDCENVYRYMVVKRDYFAEVDTWNDSLVIAWMPLPQPYAESEDEDEI